MTEPSKRSPRGARRLNLALQGGGTHGAFTWGVLDRLLEDETIVIGDISGSSAGALNGAALVTGMARGGRAGARSNLASLWEQIAQAGALMTFFSLPLRKAGMGVWDDAMPLLAPWQTNPLGMAPLRQVLRTVVDEDVLRERHAASALFVNALNVRTAASRVFGPGDLSTEALLASACAPFSYQPVQVGAEAYWDGSYSANPSLWPLYERSLDTDILLVELTPMTRADLPWSAKNILNRVNEVASVNGLVAELRAVDAIARNVPGADIRLHVVSLPEQVAGVVATEASIKRTVGRVVFETLRQEGRRACDAWLATSARHVGQRSSVDVQARYLTPHATSNAHTVPSA